MKWILRHLEIFMIHPISIAPDDGRWRRSRTVNMVTILFFGNIQVAMGFSQGALPKVSYKVRLKMSESFEGKVFMHSEG